MYALNVTRFVNAPEIRAGVMMANIIWYDTNTITGIDGFTTSGVSGVIPRRSAKSRGFPITPPTSDPKHIE